VFLHGSRLSIYDPLFSTASHPQQGTNSQVLSATILLCAVRLLRERMRSVRPQPSLLFGFLPRHRPCQGRSYGRRHLSTLRARSSQARSSPARLLGSPARQTTRRSVNSRSLFQCPLATAHARFSHRLSASLHPHRGPRIQARDTRPMLTGRPDNIPENRCQLSSPATRPRALLLRLRSTQRLLAEGLPSVCPTQSQPHPRPLSLCAPQHPLTRSQGVATFASHRIPDPRWLPPIAPVPLHALSDETGMGTIPLHRCHRAPRALHRIPALLQDRRHRSAGQCGTLDLGD